VRRHDTAIIAALATVTMFADAAAAISLPRLCLRRRLPRHGASPLLLSMPPRCLRAAILTLMLFADALPL